MRILALDTSQIQAALCLIEGGRVSAELVGQMNVAHSEALLPLIDKIIGPAALGSIDGFAVGVGPGSFTGLRIGCSTVKALAQVLDKPIYPFSSLLALQRSVEGGDRPVVAMANAYQAQVFARWESTEDVVSVENWCREHFSGVVGSRILFCGNGARVYWPVIEAAATGRAELVDVPFVMPSGIFAAAQDALSRSPIRYLDLHANYMRPSQAEITLAKTKGA